MEESKAVILKKDAEIRQQQSTITDLQTKLGQYHATLQAERKQAQEKLCLLDDAQKRLSDRFDP